MENGGNVPDWSFTKVAGPLEERFGIPATLANDGNCAALAESWKGAAAGCDDVICIVLGTGVGGGIISGGHLIEGSHGYAGEIGHFPTHAGVKPKFRGDMGCHYENYASTAALVRITRPDGIMPTMAPSDELTAFCQGWRANMDSANRMIPIGMISFEMPRLAL